MNNPSVNSRTSALIILLLIPFLSINAQQISLNEVMASNATSNVDEDGEHEDWIELFNYGSVAINLAGFGLTDNCLTPFKWVFPAVTLKPGEFLLVWASGKNRTIPGKQLHTNFSINTNGEEITLTATDGTRVDALPSTSMPTDYSFGRYPNGTGNWFYYLSATTPNAPNSVNVTVHPPEPPIFSHRSGFYTDGFTLTLSHPNPKATIIYTIDGSEPNPQNLSGVSYTYKNQYPEYQEQAFGQLLTNTYSSNTYLAPLTITDRCPEPNKLANISSTWHYAPDYFPKDPIKKATVVRALAVVDGVKSKTITATYFVSANSAFNSNLPIASISINEDALFDHNEGIYVAGKDFDNWRKSNPTEITNGHRSANYRREGIETEKTASFQYFVDGSEVINQNIGLRLHGSFSTSFQNKTFRLYARSEYDTKNSFDYPFFGPNNSSSFKRLLLRNSGNDAGILWIGVALVHTISPAIYFRDALIQKMVAHLRIDTQDYTPVITFVNGEYWGILNLRERYDEYYIEQKYGIKESELELLEGNASVKIGSNSHYTMMQDFVSSKNLSNESNYNYVKTLIDTDNFIDYQIAEIYSRNTDWPGNNIDYFRKRTNTYEPNAPYGQDGRWRWLLFDTDHGFGWTGGQSYTHNSLQNASSSTNWPTLILNKLLENQTFKNDFINRYADLLNTSFLPERLNNLINGMANNIAEEIPLHQKRWNALPNWTENVELVRQFAALRPENARSHIRSKFKISKNITATLNVSNYKEGFIRINTIDVNEKTPGVASNPYPWTGIYFNNIPLTIKAVPNPGFKFSHWSGANTSTEASITVTPTGNFSIKANFVPLKESDKELAYFWLFDNQTENDTPLKTLNATYPDGTKTATISYLSSFGEGYPFTNIHPDWRKGSMERRNAPTAVNYNPKANNDLQYGDFTMRGIQLKEPFLGIGYENTLVINISTLGNANIKLSFAAKDEGAAKRLKIDYYDKATNGWTTTNVVNSNPELITEFLPYHIDFSYVPSANNNPDFKIRIRFEGPDLTKDNGNKVTFNNIAVQGTRTITNDIQPIEMETDKLAMVFPNPTVNKLYIHTPQGLNGSVFKMHDITGKIVLTGSLNEETTLLEVTHLARGVYLLNIANATPGVYKIIKK